MNSFLNRLWQRRWLRFVTWTLLIVLTAALLVRQYANWKGGRAWAETIAKMEKSGETMDFRKLMPAPVADAENFCSIPALLDLALEPGESPKQKAAEARREALKAAGFPTDAKGSTMGRPSLGKGGALAFPTDMKAWAEWMKKSAIYPVPDDALEPAQGVLHGLGRDEALYAALSAAADRPEAQWSPHWKTRVLPEKLFSIALPHYGAIQPLFQPLALRSIAASRSGDGERAFESLHILLRLARANLNDPLLIGMLVGASADRVAVTAIWELCDARIGEEKDYRQLELELARHDYAQRLLASFRAEMIFAADTIFWLKNRYDPQFIAMMSSDAEGPGELRWDQSWIVKRLLPGGLFDLNASTVVELEHDYLIRPLRDQGLLASRNSSKELVALIVRRKAVIWQHPDSIMACLSVPVFERISQRALYSQALLDMAQVACVLERYHLEHQSYPSSLDGLTRADGRPLPLDVSSGKPIRYQQTSDGRYRLWCVGSDGIDDEGKINLDEKNPHNTKFDRIEYKGDWVWDYTRPAP